MGTPSSVIRASMLYEFKLGTNARGTRIIIFQVFGGDVVNETTMSDQFETAM